MPMVDMPLPELLKYQGRNPCPKDMDSFWDDSLAQMRKLDPQLELQPAPFSGENSAFGLRRLHILNLGVLLKKFDDFFVEEL